MKKKKVCRWYDLSAISFPTILPWTFALRTCSSALPWIRHTPPQARTA